MVEYQPTYSIPTSKTTIKENISSGIRNPDEESKKKKKKTEKKLKKQVASSTATTNRDISPPLSPEGLLMDSDI